MSRLLNTIYKIVLIDYNIYMKKNRTVKMCLLGFFVFLGLFLLLFFMNTQLCEAFGIYLLGLMFACVVTITGKSVHTGIMQSNHYNPALDENKENFISDELQETVNDLYTWQYSNGMLLVTDHKTQEQTMYIKDETTGNFIISTEKNE